MGAESLRAGNRGDPDIGDPKRRIAVVGLWLFPIKSCAGIAVERAELEARGGLKGDREWVVTNAEGEVVWQGGIPRMALVRPVPSAEGLRLHAPDTLPFTLDGQSPGQACDVKIWNETSRAFDTFPGSEAGPGAQAWLSAVLGQPLRLIRLGDGALRRHALNALHLLGLPSLRRLNDRLKDRGHRPVEVERFRPNIAIDVADGAVFPFAEEDLATIEWRRPHGALKIALGSPCFRCVVPNIDLFDASLSKEPLATLAAMSQERQPGAPVAFGVYGRNESAGSLELGEQGWATTRRGL